MCSCPRVLFTKNDAYLCCYFTSFSLKVEAQPDSHFSGANFDPYTRNGYANNCSMIPQEWTLEVRVEIHRFLLFYSSGRNHENPGSLKSFCSRTHRFGLDFITIHIDSLLNCWSGWTIAAFNYSRFITMKMETFSWWATKRSRSPCQFLWVQFIVGQMDTFEDFMCNVHTDESCLLRPALACGHVSVWVLL